MGQRRLDFFFDYSSPFGYLASGAIEGVRARHDAELVYKPFLLGALFRAIGTPDVPLAEMSDAKRRYFEDDMQRWAAFRGVTLNWPSRFPLRTVKPLRMTLLTAREDQPALIRSLMRAFWVDDADPDDDDTLRAAAAAAGLSEDLVERTRSPEAKAALRATTDEAVSRKVPGVPTFIVDDQLFWGQDRLDFVERALDGWRPL